MADLDPEERNSADEDDGDLGFGITSIAQRRMNGEFPEVLPTQLATEAAVAASAEECLSWVRKTEHVMIQSYMDERFVEYRESGVVLEGPEAVIRAKWARECYYVHLADFQAKSKGSWQVVADAFTPIFPLEAVPCEKRSAVVTLLREVGDLRAQDCVAFVTAEWDKLWASLPPVARCFAANMQRNWLTAEFENLLKTFIASVDVPTYCFEPELSTQALPFGTVRDEADKLVESVQPEQAVHIIQEVEAAVEIAKEAVPAFLRVGLGEQFRELFLKEHYFNIVRRVVETRTVVSAEFEFLPAVAVEVLDSEEARLHAIAVLRNVRQVNVRQIAEAVESQFESFLASLPAFMRNEMSSISKDLWMRKNYYSIVETVVSEPPTPSKQEPAPLTPLTEGVAKRIHASVAMIESPPSRNVRSRDYNSTALPTEASYISVAEIYQNNSQSDAYMLEAFLLYSPDEPRYVNVRDKKSGELELVPVATCVLADREGPVLVDLWRSVATSTLSLFQRWSEEAASSSSGPVLIEVKYFQTKPESRKTLVPTRKIATSERTEIIRLRAGTQRTVTDMSMSTPMEALYTRDLTRLQQTTPFVVNVAGIVGSCEEERMSQSGRSMRNFELYDPTGKYVACRVLGRHASNQNIEDGNEVILYFAQATTPTSANMPGVLWLYDESHIVLIRKNCRVPASRGAIELRPLTR